MTNYSEIDYTNLNKRIVEQAEEAARCIECGGTAVHVRHTQFAGDHPYCLEHAMEQEDYLIDDSYTYWSEA